MTEYRRLNGLATEYMVFARKNRDEALRAIGSVIAPDDDLARVYARSTYDEERWIEMAVCPRDSVIRLWGPGEGVLDA